MSQVETLEDILSANLMQIGSVELCYVQHSPRSAAHDALLTHVGDLLCLQLHRGCDCLGHF